jgi:glycosidase
VFNHVGRDFFAFRNVRENRISSQYKDWFFVWDGDSPFGDGFDYEGWEGNHDLVKLNLENPVVREYLLGSVGMWIDEFGIDGLRLDVAYLLNPDFLIELRQFTDRKKEDFWLMGETLHGDYNTWMNDAMLHSVTNYECYKGLFSSLNEQNMFEIAYSLNRQFGRESWTLYQGKQLYCFLDNHDVSRIATNLEDEALLPLAYALLFTMPGVPSVYYGGEWGFTGNKDDGDECLRPEITEEEIAKINAVESGIKEDITQTRSAESEADESPRDKLFEAISKLAAIHRDEVALCLGDYTQLYLTNLQFVFERRFEDRRIIVAFNLETEEHTVYPNIEAVTGTDLVTGNVVEIGNEFALPPTSYRIVAVDTR